MPRLGERTRHGVLGGFKSLGLPARFFGAFATRKCRTPSTRRSRRRARTRPPHVPRDWLLRGGHPGRAAADDGDAPAGAFRRRLGHDPAFSPATIDDCPLDALDCDRFGVNKQH